MYLLFSKDNSEFNTGNTEIKLGVGEQGKKQYAVPPSLRGFWHSCGEWSNAIRVAVPSAPPGPVPHPSPLPDTSQAPVSCWHMKRAGPSCAPGQLEDFRRSSAVHPTPHYPASLLFSALNYNFLPWRFTPPRSPWKVGDVWGQIWNVGPTCCSKLHRLHSPTSSDTVWFHLCQWWRLIEHQEGERTFHKTAGGKGLPIIFLLMTFRMHRFLLAVPLVLCP